MEKCVSAQVLLRVLPANASVSTVSTVPATVPVPPVCLHQSPSPSTTSSTSTGHNTGTGLHHSTCAAGDVLSTSILCRIRSLPTAGNIWHFRKLRLLNWELQRFIWELRHFVRKLCRIRRLRRTGSIWFIGSLHSSRKLLLIHTVWADSRTRATHAPAQWLPLPHARTPLPIVPTLNTPSTLQMCVCVRVCVCVHVYLHKGQFKEENQRGSDVATRVCFKSEASPLFSIVSEFLTSLPVSRWRSSG